MWSRDSNLSACLVYAMKTTLNNDRVQYVLKHGQRYTHNGLVLVCLPGVKEVGGNYAVLISKKAVPKSVGRNRMRRILRAVIQEFGCRGGDFVVLHNNRQSSEEEVATGLRLLLAKVSET